MDNANHVLDEFAEKVIRTPTGVQLNAPWAASLLDDLSQLSSAALIKQGAIGMSRNGARYHFYAGRNNTGNPIYRIFGGVTVYLMVILFAAVLVSASRFGTPGSLAGAVFAMMGAIYFGIHAAHCNKFSRLLVVMGRRGEYTRLGSNVLGVAIALGGIFGFAMKIAGV